MTFGVSLVAAWMSVLSLCKVKPSELVVLLRGSTSHPDNVAAASFAVAQIGATSLVIELGQTAKHSVPTTLKGNRAAIEAMRCADFVIDLLGMEREREQAEILASGTRILLARESPAQLIRLLPTEQDKLRVIAARDKLRSAKRMTVRSESGTSLDVRLGEYPILSQYGYADEPGMWGHWPGAFIATWPNEHSANGNVVLTPGDILLPIKEYVRSPVTLHIEKGYIRDIEGGFDARFLRDHMAMFKDPEGYAVSHLGWGLFPSAHWTALGLYDKRDTHGMEARSYLGNFMFSTGPNLEAGGTRDTACHLDIPMLDCSVSLDGTPVVIAGSLQHGAAMAA